MSPGCISQGRPSCWDLISVYLAFPCSDSTIPHVPVCVCALPPSLPGQNFQAFLGTILSVLALPVPKCWQIACFDFIVSGLQGLSFGTKSPGTSGATSLASSFCSLLPCVFLGLSCQNTKLYTVWPAQLRPAFPSESFCSPEKKFFSVFSDVTCAISWVRRVDQGHGSLSRVTWGLGNQSLAS